MGELKTITPEEIYGLYKDGNEFEIRLYQVRFDMYAEVLKSLAQKDPKYEINGIIKHNQLGRGYNDIRIIVYEGGKKIDDSYYRKTHIAQAIVKSTVSYKLALASEESIKGFGDGYSSQFFRIMVRVSSKIIDGWRLDISAVKQFTSPDQLKNALDLITKTTHTIESLTSIESSQTFMQWEIEAEWIGKSIPNESAVGNAMKSLTEMFGRETISRAELPAEVRRIASEIKDDKIPEGVTDLKNLLPGVKALLKTKYADIFPPLNYYVTEKADGYRAAIHGYGNKVVIIVGNTVHKYGSNFKSDKQLTEPLALVLDCEVLTVDGTPTGAPKLILVFDVMRHIDNVSRKTFAERLDVLEPASNLLNEFFKLTGEPITVRAKKYVHLDEEPLQPKFDEVYKAKYEYEIDGLILTSGDKSYSRTIHYKWKPASQLTIDFLARECPRELLGKSPMLPKPGMKLYLLFNGTNYSSYRANGFEFMPMYKKLFPVHSRAPGTKNNQDYFPIHFSPALNPNAYLFYMDKDAASVDNRIVELRWKSDGSDDIAGTWEFIKVREERQKLLEANRYFGNNYPIAESTFGEIMNPLRFEELGMPDMGYFQRVKDTMYAAPTAFNLFVKSQHMRSLRGTPWVMDLASGKGQDLGRYRNESVQNVIFVDSDITALNVLISRQAKSTATGEGKTRIYAVSADLTADYTKIRDRLNRVYEGQVDAVVINFAIHYLTETTEQIDNIAQLIVAVLKPGGTVLITCMDGARVFARLAGGESVWRVMHKDESGVEKLKYHIESAFNSKKLTAAGQRIKIKLPFSDELYEETLVNIDTLCTRFKKYKLLMKSRTPFDEYFDMYEKNTSKPRLTADDKEFVSLYTALTFKLT